MVFGIEYLLTGSPIKDIVSNENPVPNWQSNAVPGATQTICVQRQFTRALLPRTFQFDERSFRHVLQYLGTALQVTAGCQHVVSIVLGLSTIHLR